MHQSVKKYVDYMTTDELAACVQRTTDKLSTLDPQADSGQIRLLRAIRNDLLNALDARQLSLYYPVQLWQAE